MTDKDKPKRDWLDLLLKALTPVMAGLVIAWVGFFGESTLTKINSRQESARLITELQIKREQAESELRKDIFDQALEAFLLKKPDNTGTLKDVSKQLLRLELLALNFGDSLSLSPLFIEFKNDLDSARPIKEEEKRNYEQNKALLQKRLDSLARRVASTQLSSIAQHGSTKGFEVPLYEYAQLSDDIEDNPCKTMLFENRHYPWPRADIHQQFGLLDENFKPIADDTEISEIEDSPDFKDAIKSKSLLELNGIKRYLEAHFSHVDHCRKTAKVQIILKRDAPEDPELNPPVVEVDREFTLDYFNFPMVDNTRLSDNHRFAIVMESFNLKGDQPQIELTGVVFPSEYASLRDRPGMQEARKLLESALENGDRE